MSRISVLGAACLASLLLVGAVQAGGVYKFVDKQGRVHFADRPQAGWKRVDVTDPLTASEAAEASAAAQTETARRASECASKKKQLADYQNATRVVETDALGRPREYSAEEKAKLIDLTQRQIAELCAPLAAPAESAESAEAPAEAPATP